MVTVTLVATLATAALWQQWRGVEVESAERTRTQLAWVLTGALDWARLILREDARSGGADHLGEPWAVPLEEARLSTFLAAEKGVATNVNDAANQAFLSTTVRTLGLDAVSSSAAFASLAAAAKGTALATFPKVCVATTPANVVHKWRVVSLGSAGTGAVGTTVVI